jgi:DNA-directed RNA polymerase specialized sigma24 family protein
VSPPPPPPIPEDQKTAFDREVEKHYLVLFAFLIRACKRHGIRGESCKDFAQETFRLAFQKEREGKHWDPAVTPIQNHLELVLSGLRSNARRGKERKPDIVAWPQKHDPASDGKAGDVALIERDEEMHLGFLEVEVHKRLAADPRGGLALRILEKANEAQVSKHAELAKLVGCTLPEVRRAAERIAEHARKVREQHGAVAP